MKRNLALIALALALVVTACSDDDAPSTTAVMPTQTVAPTTTGVPATTAPPIATTGAVTSAADTTTSAPPAAVFPVTIEHAAGSTEIPGRPMRIAALSATHVEMLFAIGAGPQVIAGDLFSNYPPAAVETLDLVDSFNLNVEAIVALDPDLVVLSFDPGEAVDALEAVGVPTLLFGTASDLQDVYDQILAMGRASGHEEEAVELIASMQSDIEVIIGDVGDRLEGMTFYHESDPFSFYTPNSSSFIGSLYEMLGMENIADAAPDPSNSGFPQLSAEFIVSSDPEIIYVAGFGESLDTVAEREGWDAMTAVEKGNVVTLDTDVASRWGPRVVDLLRSIAEAALSVQGG